MPRKKCHGATGRKMRWRVLESQTFRRRRRFQRHCTLARGHTVTKLNANNTSDGIYTHFNRKYPLCNGCTVIKRIGNYISVHAKSWPLLGFALGVLHVGSKRYIRYYQRQSNPTF